MTLKQLIAAAAALSMATLSTAAAAQSAQPALERIEGESELKGSTVIVGLLALSAIIGGAIIASQSKGRPTSP